MKSLKIFLLIIPIIIFQINTYCQPTSSLKGIGIELGGGQNNLFWSKSIGILTIGAGATNRTHLSFTPNFRILYDLNLPNSYTLMGFIGYNRFGGCSKIQEEIQSKYYFDAIEVGTYMLYKISNLKLGVGLKLNYHLNVSFQYITPTETYKINRSEWFTKYSGDFGLRTTYLIKPISLSFDAWFGINDLRNSKILPSDGTIRENHYRFLIGYIF